MVSAPQPSPQWTNCSYNYGGMHYACTKWPYFHFRSIIWRYNRVSRPRFPVRRQNFGNSCRPTFKADIGLLNSCMKYGITNRMRIAGTFISDDWKCATFHIYIIQSSDINVQAMRMRFVIPYYHKILSCFCCFSEGDVPHQSFLHG